MPLAMKTLWLWATPTALLAPGMGVGQSWSLLLLDPALHRDGHEEQWQWAICPVRGHCPSDLPHGGPLGSSYPSPAGSMMSFEVEGSMSMHPQSTYFLVEAT